ncbi:hypothetical protein ACQ4PT_023031 [Festuca glaucescens]
MAIECLVLGAGQEVGKSCVVVTISGKRIMFDCGMHMGHHDCQRYPDFARILSAAPGATDFTSAISCVVITHFHLDHIGALPYFTEVCGYNGPVYMTELCILLDDYWERMNLKIPIYFSAGLTIQANMYYKMLIGWTSQKIKDSYTVHNPFDFKHVCHFERSFINDPGPCVLFATPANNETVSILTTQYLKINATEKFITSCTATQYLKINATEKFITSCTAAQARDGLQKANLLCGNHLSGVNGDEKPADGILLMEKSKAPKILCEDELLQLLGTERHSVQFEPLLMSRIEEAGTTIVNDVHSE